MNIRELTKLSCVTVFIAGALIAPHAKTRWSTLQLLPGADVISNGRFVADADLLWPLDSFTVASLVSVQRIHVGISDWMNIDIGHADGFTMGLKANFLKENPKTLRPTLTLGFQNLYMSREALYFGAGDGYPKNEFYLVAAKTSEWAKLRGHVGIMSAATCSDERDYFNPYLGLEKYFGQGLYMTAELQRRSGEFLLSIFAVYRIVADRLEFSLGVVDVPGLARTDSPDSFLLRPGLRAGLKAYIGGGYNSQDGLGGVEDRIDRFRDTIETFAKRLDSLNAEIRWNAQRIHELSGFTDDRREERDRVVDELTKLNNMYNQEPFDPEIVRNAIDGIGSRRAMFLPHLRVIVTDPEVPLRLRTLAVSLLGELRDSQSSNVLMSMLGRFEDPSLKIEIIIALGKIKEPRCGPILKTLRADPDDGVAFTAAEVYKALFGDDKKVSPAAAEEDTMGETVPERRLNR